MMVRGALLPGGRRKGIPGKFVGIDTERVTLRFPAKKDRACRRYKLFTG